MKAISRPARVVSAVAFVVVFVAFLTGLSLWRRARDPTSDPVAGQTRSDHARMQRGLLRLADGTASSGPPGAIAGRVRDPSGGAVAGAAVALTAVSTPGRAGAASGALPLLVAHAVTSADGRFRLAPVPAGVYRAAASAPGFVPSSGEDITVERGETVAGIDLVLARGGHTLSGRVLDSGGGPIPGGRVRVFVDGRWSRSAARPVGLALADGQGAYRLTLPAGHHAVAVEADGYAPAWASLQISGNSTRDFRLHPASVIAGRVVRRGTGAGVANAQVTAHSRGYAGEATTDAEGVFTIGDLEPGQYGLHALAGSVAGRSVRPVTVGLAARVEGVVVEVEAGRSLAGRVRRRGGKAVDGAHLSLAESLAFQDGSGRRREETHTGTDGAFRFDGLLPGTYGVGVNGPGITRAQRQVTVALADLSGIDFEVEDAAVVRGQVVGSDSRPAEGAIVFAHIGEWGTLDTMYGPVHAGADGRFRIEDLPPGPLSLSAKHPQQGRVFLEVGPLHAAEEREVNLRLRGGVRIRGRVTWDDGVPAAGVVVTASAGRDGMGSPVTTEPDGRYSVGPFEVGAAVYLQVEQAAGWQGGSPTGSVSSQMVRMERPEDVDGVDFELARSETSIRGVVVGPDGRPLGGAVVSSRPGRTGVRVLTGDDGGFELEDLVRGTYLVRAEQAGLPPAEVAGVVAGSANLRIRIEAGARLAGKVTRVDGRPVGPYTVWAQPSRGAPGFDEENPSAAAADRWVNGEDGAFEIGGLSSGVFDVLVSTIDGDSGVLPRVAVRAGEARRGLVVDIGAGLTLKGRVVDFDSSRPLAGVGARAVSDRRTRGGRTEAAGGFQLDGLPVGVRVELELERPGFMPYSRTFDPPVEKSVFNLGDVPLVAKRPAREETGRVGLVLGLDNQGQIVVRGVLPAAPAAKAGVKAGDLLLSIHGRNLRNADLGSVVALIIDGEPGTPLLLEVRSGNGPSRRIPLSRM